MTKTKLLIGSLSNDLYRVATLSQRGSHPAASTFFVQAQRWCSELVAHPVSPSTKRIVTAVKNTPKTTFTLAQAEEFLLYSILLQNRALHME